MASFTPQEYADMHFVYGFCNGNSSAAVREYQSRFPNRRVPSSAVFTRVHQRLAETGSFGRQDARVGALPHDVGVEEYILERVEEEPTVSTRGLSREVGLSPASVSRILRANNFHPYHFTPIHGLVEGDEVHRERFCRWLLNSDIEQHNFLRRILWTDESLFTREGLFNQHNYHHWAVENPHQGRQNNFQHRFQVNVWAGVIGDQLIGPHILPPRLNGETYLDFLQNTLPELLLVIPEEQRNRIIFMQDGAPPHYSRAVREYLNGRFDTWIGRDGVVPWPPRSPDLTPLDFFVWGYLKEKIYSSPVANEEDLRGRIRNTAEELQQELSLRITVGAMRKRARACIRQNGGHFENLLS